jgi:hypothetical protein
MPAKRDWSHQPADWRESIVCQTLLEGMGPLEPLILRHDPRFVAPPRIGLGRKESGPRFAALLAPFHALMALKH